MSNYAEAERWLGEAGTRALPTSSRECLMAATVHALLAVADAIHGTACQHCMAAAHDQGACSGPDV